MSWKSKKHLYYVVYFYSSQNGFGVASNIIQRDNKLNSEKGIKGVQEALCKEIKCENVVILNWKELKN